MQSCRFLNCHNLGDSNWNGYCNEDHSKKAEEYERLWKILEKNPHLSTLRDAKRFLKEETKDST
jgi:hypothetical protein